MEKYIVNGGAPLYGSVKIQGSKNSAVAILIACIAVKGIIELDNLPQISDVRDCVYILKCLGAKIYYYQNDEKIRIDTSNLFFNTIPAEVQQRMRASSYLMGAQLSRFSYSETAFPGGCDFGGRPVNLHIEALSSLGAECNSSKNNLIFTAENRLQGNTIHFPFATVGGTINTVIAAATAKGTTVIQNAAKEPHVIDLINFLNKCGANIKGAGTSTLVIYGVDTLHGCEFSISSDMIEAGTFLIMGLATGGRIECTNIHTDDLNLLTSVLLSCGANIKKRNDHIAVWSERQLYGCYIKTQPFPGFPTDMHPQLTVLLSLAHGKSIIEETVFNYRFKYLEPLKKMGVNAITSGNVLQVSGDSILRPADINATDLRGGAALLTAALCAKGKSTLSSVNYIERGYSYITEKLKTLGADITRISIPDNNLPENEKIV